MNLQIINGCAGTDPGLPLREPTLVDATARRLLKMFAYSQYSVWTEAALKNH